MPTDTAHNAKKAAQPFPSIAKRRLFGALMVVLSLGVAILGAEGVARWHLGRIQKSDALDPGLTQYDRLLGWQLAPHWRGRHRHHDFDVSYTINRYGFRGMADGPGKGLIRRIAVVGDSFTFGFGVNEAQTFTALLNQRLNGRGVFFNFGVPGYSTDQQVLLIKERVLLFAPDHIVLVVCLFNDLIDNLLPYPMQTNRAKPYFTSQAGGLRLQNVPVPTAPKPPTEKPPEWLHLVSGAAQGSLSGMASRLALARVSGLTDRFSGPCEAELSSHLAPAKALFAQLLQQLQEDCHQHGVCLSLVLMPGSAYVARPASASARMQDHIRRWIRIALASSRMPVIDLADRLRSNYNEKKQRLYFPNEGHLTPPGHEVVAEILAGAGLDRLCQIH